MLLVDGALHVVVKGLRRDVRFVGPLDGVPALVDTEAAEELRVPQRLEHRAAADQVGEVHVGRQPIGEAQTHPIPVERDRFNQVGWKYHQWSHGASVDKNFRPASGYCLPDKMAPTLDIGARPLAPAWLGRLFGRFRPSSRGRYAAITRFQRPAAVNRDTAMRSAQARDRLLLFIALEGAPSGLDPIRIQKGMFLFAHEGAPSDDEKYDFVPYNYGPMSKDIYKDLDQLQGEELIRTVPVEGQSWTRYIVTTAGVAKARDLLADERSEVAARQLLAIKRAVATKTFSELLDDVYERFPEYAANSIFRRGS